MNITDEDIYNEILEDNAKGILLHQQLNAILKDKKHPYFDGGHMDHSAAVRKVEMLHEFKFGNEPYINEVMPIVSETAKEPNAVQEGAPQIARMETEDDDIFSFLDR